MAGADLYPLHYGDEVALFADDFNGWVASEGWVDPRVWLDVYSGDNAVPDCMEHLRFRVLPRLQYAGRKQRLKQLRAEAAAGGIVDEAMTSKTRKLEEKEQEERENNENEVKRMHGRLVHFGATIQLQHVVSGKFLSIEKRISESTNKALKVTLRGDEADDSWFCLMPGNKLKESGHQCYMGDFVSLLSIKHEDQWLGASHVNWKTYRSDDLRRVARRAERTLEVNSGGTALSCMLVPVSDASSAPPPSSMDAGLDDAMELMRGGDVVTIFNRHLECFLSEEKGRPCFRRSSKGSTNNTRSLWMVESPAMQWSRGPLIAGSGAAYRLRNLVTGNYLCTTPEGAVHAEAVPEKPHTTWKFEPYQAPDNSELATGAFVLLRNASAGSYINGTSRPVEFNDDATSPEGSPRSKRGKDLAMASLADKCLEVETGQSGKERDVLVMELADDDIVRTSFQMSCLSSHIRQFCTDKFSGLPDQESDSVVKYSQQYESLLEVARSAESINMLLTEACHLMSDSADTNPRTREGIPCRMFQKVFREHGVATWVFQLLRAPLLKGLAMSRKDGVTSLEDDEMAPILHTIQIAYSLLRLCCRDYVKNKIELSQYILVMSDHIRGKLLAASALREMFHECTSLLHKKIDDAIVDKFLMQIDGKRQRLPRYVRFLSAIVVSEGRPIATNQDRVARKMFAIQESRGSSGGVRVSTTSKFLLRARCYDSNGRLILAVQDGDKNRLVELNQFCNRDDDIWMRAEGELGSEEVLMRYHASSVNLLADLLRGRNRYIFDRVVRLQDTVIRYKDLLRVVFSPDIPFRVRTPYAHLLLRLYVDRDPLVRTNPLALVLFRDNGLSSNKKLQQLMRSSGPFELADIKEFAPTSDYSDLKKLCVEYLVKANSIDSKNTGENEFTVAILDIIKFLLEHAYFAGKDGRYGTDMTDLRELVEPVLDLLDGRDDFPEGSARYDLTADNMLVMDIKKRTVEIFDFIYDVSLNLRVHLFFQDFERRFRKYVNTHPHLAVVEGDGADDAHKCFETFLNTSFQHHPSRPAISASRSQARLRKYTDLCRQDDSLAETAKMTEVDLGPETDDQGSGSARRALIKSLSKGSAFELQDVDTLSRLYERNSFADMQRVLFKTAALIHEHMTPGTEGWMIDVLLDNSNYEDCGLALPSLELFYRHMQQPASFVKTALSGYPIHTAASRLYARQVYYLKSEIVRYLKWIPTESRQLLLEQSGEDSYIEVQTILLTLTASIRCVEDTDHEEARRRQYIMARYNVHEAVVDILQMPLHLNDDWSPKIPGLRDLFQFCYTFLLCFCRNHRENQDLLSRYAALFISHMGTKDLDIASTIVEIVRDNTSIIENIAAGFFMKLITLLQVVGLRARWLRAFSPFLVSNGFPIKENQRRILKLIFDNDVVDVPIGDEAVKGMIKLMAEDEHKKGGLNSRLSFICTSIEILHLCTLGRNHSNELKVRSLLSFDDLTSIIVDAISRAEGVSDDTKRYVMAPFVKLLHSVYLDAAEREEVRTLNLPTSRWFDGNSMGEASVMTTLVENVYSLVVRVSGQKSLTAATCDVDTTSHMELVLDAIIPVLAAFYATAFCEDKEHQSFGAEQRRQSKILDTALACLLRVLPIPFVSDRRCQAICSLARALSEHGYGEAFPFTEKLKADVAAKTSHLELDLDDNMRQVWTDAVYAQAQELGVKDIVRFMGRGMLNMARLLGKQSNEIYISNILRCLANVKSVPRQSIATSFRTIRAILYLNPAETNQAEIMRHYDLFVQTKPIAQPPEIRDVQQSRFIEYDITGTAAEMILVKDGHTIDYMTSITAVRLLNSLLQGGNEKVQISLTGHFIDSRSPMFWRGIHECLRSGARSAKKEHKNKRKLLDSSAAEMQAAAARRQAYTTETCEMLEQMTAGGNTRLQDFFREQPRNGQSFNIITSIVEYATALMNDVKNMESSRKPILVLCSLFGTCRNLILGPNRANQDALIHAGVLDAINRMFLQLYNWGLDSPLAYDSSSLRMKMLLVINGLLEGVHGGPTVQHLLTTINWRALQQSRDSVVESIELLNTESGWFWNRNTALVSADTVWTDEHSPEEVKTILMEEANVYMFLVKLISRHDPLTLSRSEVQVAASTKAGNAVCKMMFSKEHCSRLSRGRDGYCVFHAFNANPAAVKMMNDNTATIEIMRDGMVCDLHFSTLGVKERHIRDSTTKELMLRSLLDGYDEQAQDRLRNGYGILHDLYFLLYTQKELGRRPLTSWIRPVRKVFSKLPLFLAVMINILFVLFMKNLSGVLQSSDAEDVAEVWAHMSIRVLMVAHIIIAFVFSFLYFSENARYIVFQKTFNDKPEKLYSVHHDDHVGRWSVADKRMITMDERSRSLRMSKIVKFWQGGAVNVPVFYYLFYPICSVMGLFISPAFYLYHMLEILSDPTIALVIKSVSQNIDRLYKTAILAILLVYIFSMVAFQFFGGDLPECNSPFSCFVGLLYLGAVGQPIEDGIADFQIPETLMDVIQSRAKFTLLTRMVFESAFGMLFILILLAIISGIIIDSFGQLRDEMQNKMDNLQHKCYICGLTRQAFEEAEQDFDHHIRHEHNLWHYMYFLSYASSKDPLELTGDEKYLVAKLVSMDLSAFPVGKCNSIETAGRMAGDTTLVGESQGLAKEVKGLDSKVDSVIDRLDGLEASIGALTEMMKSHNNGDGSGADKVARAARSLMVDPRSCVQHIRRLAWRAFRVPQSVSHGFAVVTRLTD